MSSRLAASCYLAAQRSLAQSAIASARPWTSGRLQPNRLRGTPFLPPPLYQAQRAYNVNGNEVKAGSTIKWEGKTYVVLETVVNMRGRAHTTYNVSCACKQQQHVTHTSTTKPSRNRCSGRRSVQCIAARWGLTGCFLLSIARWCRWTIAHFSMSIVFCLKTSRLTSRSLVSSSLSVA